MDYNAVLELEGDLKIRKTHIKLRNFNDYETCISAIDQG